VECRWGVADDVDLEGDRAAPGQAVGIVNVTVLGSLDASVGTGSGQPSPPVVQSSGTGPIEVPVALASPSSGTVALKRSSWMVAPRAAWLNNAQVRVKVTGLVKTSPGDACPRSMRV
jgi:hypothetical protein